LTAHVRGCRGTLDGPRRRGLRGLPVSLFSLLIYCGSADFLHANRHDYVAPLGDGALCHAGAEAPLMAPGGRG
jgi:hypothetical protein